MPLLREKKEPVLRAPKRSPVYYDKVYGWVRHITRKRKPSKTAREIKREFHNAVRYFTDEIRSGLE